MSLPKTAKSISDAEKASKVSYREFIKITLWAAGLVQKAVPVQFNIYLVARVVGSFDPLVQAYLFAKILDAAVIVYNDQTRSFIPVYTALIYYGLYLLAQTILSVTRTMLNQYIRQYARFRISRLFYTHLHKLGTQTLEQPSVNNKIYRADEYIGNVVNYTYDSFEILTRLIQAISAGVIVFLFNPYIGLLLLFISLPYFINDKFFRRKIYEFGFVQTEPSRVASRSSGDLRSVKTMFEVAVSNAFPYLDNKYYEFQDWYAKKALRILRKWATLSNTLGIAEDIVRMFCYVLLIKQFVFERVSFGTLAYRFRYIEIFKNSTSGFFQYLNDQYESSIRLREGFEIFSTKPYIKNGNIDIGVLVTGPDVVLKDVNFSYPRSEKLIYENLSLNIKSGEKVAIVGPNGAGKTTLVKLLCRIYDPISGSILINNVDLTDISYSSLYRNVSLLPQEFNRYNQLTVRENIYIGNSDKPVDEIALRIAAQSADALEFIENLPNKFDQVLDETFEGGVRLSTGQWQKLAIARFFYRNAPLVIFDEPTASIDAVSEYNIFNRIYEFFKNKTVIIISHRFSTVRNADRILVMENGAIIEDGTHNHLMAKNGYYAKAFLLQAEGYTSS